MNKPYFTKAIVGQALQLVCDATKEGLPTLVNLTLLMAGLMELGRQAQTDITKLEGLRRQSDKKRKANNRAKKRIRARLK